MLLLLMSTSTPLCMYHTVSLYSCSCVHRELSVVYSTLIEIIHTLYTVIQQSMLAPSFARWVCLAPPASRPVNHPPRRAMPSLNCHPPHASIIITIVISISRLLERYKPIELATIKQ